MERSRKPLHHQLTQINACPWACLSQRMEFLNSETLGTCLCSNLCHLPHTRKSHNKSSMQHSRTGLEPSRRTKNHSRLVMDRRNYSTVVIRSQTNAYSDFNIFGEALIPVALEKEEVYRKILGTTRVVTCTIMTSWSLVCCWRSTSSRRWKLWMKKNQATKLYSHTHKHHNTQSNKGKFQHIHRYLHNTVDITREGPHSHRTCNSLYGIRSRTKHCTRVSNNISTLLQLLRLRQARLRGWTLRRHRLCRMNTRIGWSSLRIRINHFVSLMDWLLSLMRCNRKCRTDLAPHHDHLP